jgi:hypothetical protein
VGTIVLKQTKLNVGKIRKEYRCSCCGDTKIRYSYAIIILGWIIDLDWFPFISISKLGEPL